MDGGRDVEKKIKIEIDSKLPTVQPSYRIFFSLLFSSFPFYFLLSSFFFRTWQHYSTFVTQAY